MEVDKAENQDSTKIKLDSLFKLYDAGKIVNEDGQLYIKQNGKSPTNITSAYCILPLKEVEYDGSNVLSRSDSNIDSYISRARILLTKQELTLEDIMKVTDKGKPYATKVRKDALKYCEDNMIYIYGRGVPASAVTAVTGISVESLLSKGELELRLLELEGEQQND